MRNSVNRDSRKAESILWLMVGATLTSASWGAVDPQTPRQLSVPLAAPETIIQRNLTVDDLQIHSSLEIQNIQSLYRNQIGVQPDRAQQTWKVVVYFDAPLATPDGLRMAAGFLSREADTLIQLGTTEIVLADPNPREFLASTRDPVALKEAFHDLRGEALTTGKLLWHRQRFSSTEDGIESSAISQAVQQEVAIIEHQQQSLLRWLNLEDHVGPRLLILVQNGHDMNPGTFYADQAASTFLESPRSRFSQSLLSKAVAADGWTVVCLALGPRHEEFSDASAPLFELARATGGEVVTGRRDGSRLLDRISGWPILVLDATAPPGVGTAPFEVVHRPTGKKLQTRQWATAATSSLLEEFQVSGQLANDKPKPILMLLRPEGLSLEGEVRFRTIAGRQRIHRVEFLLDDEVVSETERSPFSAVIDLGTGVSPHTVTAVAYSRTGRKLGEDSLQLNIALEPPRVTITTLQHDPNEGVLEFSAVASSPSGDRPDRIEIFFNHRREAILTEPPYHARIAVDQLAPADFVRVVAHYPKGALAEAARLTSMTGPGNELVVNLVELLAMVTPRNRKMQVELEQSDFVIRQQGKLLQIDQFSRWEQLQLTLGLVLDTSNSMDEVIEDTRQAGERFFEEALEDGDEAFVVDFNSLPRLAHRMTTDSDQLLDSLTGIEAHGLTALYDAIVYSLQQFEDSAGRRALVVLTDGEDSASHFQPSECVRQARLHGVPIYLIILGSPPDPHREPELLRNLMVARRTGGEVYYISDLDDLGRIYDQIISELRRQYFLAFNAGHTLTPEELGEIEIEVLSKGVQVRTLLASQQRGGSPRYPENPR